MNEKSEKTKRILKSCSYRKTQRKWIYLFSYTTSCKAAAHAGVVSELHMAGFYFFAFGLFAFVVFYKFILFSWVQSTEWKSILRHIAPSKTPSKTFNIKQSPAANNENFNLHCAGHVFQFAWPVTHSLAPEAIFTYFLTMSKLIYYGKVSV